MEIISGRCIGSLPDDILSIIELWRMKNVVELVNNWKRSELGAEQVVIDPPSEEDLKELERSKRIVAAIAREEED